MCIHRFVANDTKKTKPCVVQCWIAIRVSVVDMKIIDFYLILLQQVHQLSNKLFVSVFIL